MPANSKMVGGSHYITGGISHWDLIHDNGVCYLVGNATKYLTRFRKKNGLQDLQKALHYVEKLLEKCAGDVRTQGDVSDQELQQFFEDNQIGLTEREPIRLLLTWTEYEHLRAAKAWVEAMIAEYDGSAPGAGYVKQD